MIRTIKMIQSKQTLWMSHWLHQDTVTGMSNYIDEDLKFINLNALTARLWTVGESQSTWREQRQTQREHVNSKQKGPQPNGGVRQQCHHEHEPFWFNSHQLVSCVSLFDVLVLCLVIFTSYF